MRITVTVRIGYDWWTYLRGNPQTYIELCVALIRSCVEPTNTSDDTHSYIISNLASIVSTDIIPTNFNVGILQKSQYPWLFFLVKHFCDDLLNA